MRIGQLLTYVDTRGKEHAATLVEITDAGPSGYKIVSLTTVESTTPITGVSHYLDVEKGKGYWILPSESETYPDRRAPIEKQPIKLAKAEAARILPENDRRSES